MRASHAWLLLLAAGAAEVLMAGALKSSAGWTRLGPSLLGIGAAAVSILLLTLALRQLPVGLAYAMWTGIGAAGVVATGALLHGEALTGMRLFYLALIVAGVLGLRLDSSI